MADPPVPPRHPIASWVQALGIIAVVGVAVFDLTRPDESTPSFVYGALVAIVVLLDPTKLKDLLK